jgi:hypothetical protein
MIEQQAGLEAAAAPIFDQQAARPDRVNDFAHGLAHDREFGAGQVVFIQLADFLKQARAPGVIEILAGKFPGIFAQPLQHVRQESGVMRRRGGEFQRMNRHYCTSLASRSPVNCQRASGGKKLR